MARKANRKLIRAAATGNRSIPEKPEGRTRELFGILLLGLGLAFAFSLVSYVPGGRGDVNWLGPVGNFFADNILWAMGLSGYAVVFAMFLAAFMSFGLGDMEFRISEVLAFLVMVFSGAALFELAISVETIFNHPPGGALGKFLGAHLSKWLSIPGAILFVVTALLLSLTVTTGLSVGSALKLAGTLISKILVISGRTTAYLASRARVELSLALKRLDERLKAYLAERKELKAAERRRRLEAMTVEFVSIEAGERKRGKQEKISEPKIIVGDTEISDADIVEEKKLSTPSLPSVSIEPRVIGGGEESVMESIQNGSAPEITAGEVVPEIELDNISESEPVVDGVSPSLQTDAPIVEERRLEINDPKGPVIIEMAPEERATHIPDELKYENFKLPSTDLLSYHGGEDSLEYDPEELRTNAKLLEKKLNSYGVTGQVKEIRVGPVVTVYEYLPDAGVKSSKVSSLSNDLALQLSVSHVRIVPNIPGKGVMGIEVPNKNRQTVSFRTILESKQFVQAAGRNRLPLAIGKNIEGVPYSLDLRKMPHMLLAGATGTGKSVGLNTMVMSLIMRNSPADVKLILIDPKMVELSIYNEIPHLLLPVIVDPMKASLALMWAVDEMERRYEMLAEMGARGIDTFNKKLEMMREELERKLAAAEIDNEEYEAKKLGIPDKMPYIVLVIDELADLMIVAARDVEKSITRLSQKARAAGIHLIFATQRPSTDVLTGTIKANFPVRISCKTSSQHDSKTILNTIGSESLLGMGDMLILPPGSSELARVQGALVDEEEIRRVVEFLKEQGAPVYNEEIIKPREEVGEADTGERDPLYQEAVIIVRETRSASISALQRRLRVGYNRAARMVEDMEKDGIVGPPNGPNPREVLLSPC